MNLEELRAELDKVDDELLELFVRRFQLTEQVGHFKAKNNMPVISKEREEEMMNRLRAKADESGLSGEHAENIWRAVINEVVKNHNHIKETYND